MSKILIVEDSRVQAMKLAQDLKGLLAVEAIDIARDGLGGLERARATRPDLIVLDLMLPLKDGLDVLRELRAGPSTVNIPVIVLTAKHTEVDELIGFVLGADDYVVKPYRARVLAARVEALLRKGRAPSAGAKFLLERYGLSINLLQHRAMFRGRELTLTPTEFNILKTLLRRPDRIITRKELIDSLVGEHGTMLEKTVSVYIGKLRAKLGEDADLVETIRGVGYRLRDPSRPRDAEAAM